MSLDLNFKYDETENVSHKWSNYVFKIQNYMLTLANNTTDEKKRALFLSGVGDQIINIYRTMEDDDDNVDAIIEKITNYFNPVTNKFIFIRKFNQAKQENNESIDKYVGRLKQLSSNCEFGNQRDDHIVQKLICDCKNEKILDKVYNADQDDVNLNQFISWVRENEYKQNDLKQQNQQASTSFPFNSNDLNQINKVKSNSKCFYCGYDYPHKDKCPAYGSKCYNCNGYNHFASMCKKAMKEKQKESKQSSDRSNKKRYDKKAKYKKRHQTNNINKSSSSSSSDEENTKSSSSYDSYKSTLYRLKVNCIHNDEISRKMCEICSSSSKQKSIERRTVYLTMFGQIKKFMIDSGSDINAIDKITYYSLTKQPELSQVKTPVFAYGSAKPLRVLGKFEHEICINNLTMPVKFLVIEGNSGCIMSERTAFNFNLIQYNTQISNCVKQISSNNEYDKLLSQMYPNVFSNKIGKMKNVKIKIDVDEDITPIQEKYRHLPFHLRDKVEKELKNMIENDVIERVSKNDKVTWLSPIVPVTKSNSDKVRICIDAKPVNKAIKRIKSATPTVEDLCVKLNGAQFVSKIDLKAAFNQIELDKNSRHLTTFVTHVGLFRYKRLNFGISCAPEIFQQLIFNLIKDIPNSFNISDDILIFGNDQQSHDQALHEVMQRLNENNLTVNQDKCEWFKTELDFFGLHFSKDGVSLSDSKIKDFIETKTPKNKSDLHSFLGLGTYCSRFIRNYASKSTKLWELTRKSTEFKWTSEHDQIFEKLKSSIIKHALAYFNKDHVTELYVDASPDGIGAVLVQYDPNNPSNKKIIAFASRCLNELEKKYSQVEREALAIIWACQRFHLYLYGSEFILYTDNKALEFIFNNNKKKPPPRIERWALKVLQYRFNVIHKPGKENIADYLSRYPAEVSASNNLFKLADQHINAIIDYSPVVETISKNKLVEESAKDSIISKLMHLIQLSI